MLFTVFMIKTKPREWRHIYDRIEIQSPNNHDVKIPETKHRDIENTWLKHHYIKTRTPLSHDIVISKYFFGGQKVMTSGFLDWKTIDIAKLKGNRYLESSSISAKFWCLCPMLKIRSRFKRLSNHVLNGSVKMEHLPKTFDYFRKMFHLRRLAEFWIRHCKCRQR